MRGKHRRNTAGKLRLAKRLAALCFAVVFFCSCLLPAFASSVGGEGKEESAATSLATTLEELSGMKPVVDAGDEEGEAPSESPAPSESEAPSESPAPSESEAPSESPAPSESEAPSESPEPSESEAPSESQPTEKPAASDSEPAKKDEPASSSEPAKKEEPAASSLPAKEEPAASSGSESGKDEKPASSTTGSTTGYENYTATYRFWLKELSSYDLADIAKEARALDMTESEYLAYYGEESGLFFMMTLADGENLADYKSQFPTPDSDPTGEERSFSGWYTLDEYSDSQPFQFADEPLILTESTTTDVFAKWTAKKPVTEEPEEPAEDEDPAEEPTEDEEPAEEPVEEPTEDDGDKGISDMIDAETAAYAKTQKTEQTVYVYVQVTGSKDGLTKNAKNWYTIGYVDVDLLPITQTWLNQNKKYAQDLIGQDAYYTGTSTQDDGESATMYNDVVTAVTSGSLVRKTYNTSIDVSKVTWSGPAFGEDGKTYGHGLRLSQGANDFDVSDKATVWHLDGYIDIADMADYEVHYWVEDANGDKESNGKTYSEVTRLKVAEAAIVGSTISAGNGYTKYETIPEGGVEYSYSHSEPADEITITKNGTNRIDLYYVRPTSDVTITKHVEGNMGDKDREFNFRITVKLNGADASFKLGETSYTGSATFTLKDGESVDVKDIPIGATLTVTETDAEGYEVSAELGEKAIGEKQTGGGTFSFTVSSTSSGDAATNSMDDGLMLLAMTDDGVTAAGNDLIITNTLDIQPATGVLLDTLPYLLILAVVAAGGVFFIVRRRHHHDD